jgi:hypothetical protein
MEKIFKHLSAGGTLVDYCKLVGQPYAELMAWVQASPDRVAQYEAAKRARQDWLYEQVLRQYKALSELDIRELYGPSGELLDMVDWPEGAALAVAGVESMEVTEMVDGQQVPVGVVKKVKTYDKNKSLEALGKHLRMFADVLEVRGEISIRGALDEAEARWAAARQVAASEQVESGSESGSGSVDQEPI